MPTPLIVTPISVITGTHNTGITLNPVLFTNPVTAAAEAVIDVSYGTALSAGATWSIYSHGLILGVVGVNPSTGRRHSQQRNRRGLQ